jgi:hypothetical protein
MGLHRGLSLAIFAPLVVSATTPSIRAILSQHDPEGRLPHTIVEQRGTIRVGRAKFTILYLNFTNPISHHGQQRIAIIRNNREFAGAYQCTLSTRRGDATMVIRNQKVLVYLNDLPRVGEAPFVITFTERGPSRNTYFCGEGSGWENSI